MQYLQGRAVKSTTCGTLSPLRTEIWQTPRQSEDPSVVDAETWAAILMGARGRCHNVERYTRSLQRDPPHDILTRCKNQRIAKIMLIRAL